jgi:3-dehydrotetronate 4-kinase
MVFGCIADDLTGGVELASMLVAQGVRTSFSIGLEQPALTGSDAHVIALKTRVAPATEAVAEVVRAGTMLHDWGCRSLFFKYCATFDSTPAGNIGPCAEALLDLLGADFTIFAPAYCEVGRTVFQGHLFAGHQLLSESPKRFDPLTPMTDSNLLRVLSAQSTRTVGLVPHAAVHAGVDGVHAAIAALRAKGVTLAIADAIYEADLEVLARSCADLPLLTGNSSIAGHLPRVWRGMGLLPREGAATSLPGVGGPAAVLVGSCAERTAEQLAHFARSYPVLRLDLAEAYAGADLAKIATEWAAEQVGGRPFGISTAAEQDEVSRLQDRHGRLDVAARAEQIISDVASELVHTLGVRRLIVAGGETSGAILKRLDVKELTVGSYEGPGIARVVTREPYPLALLLKSGKLGGIAIFETVLDAMKHATSAALPDARWLDA